MANYYLKDNANGIDPVWDAKNWVSTHKQDLKNERDRLNKEFSPEESKYKRFVIGTMK